jgi:hypothetical protein
MTGGWENFIETRSQTIRFGRVVTKPVV